MYLKNSENIFGLLVFQHDDRNLLLDRNKDGVWESHLSLLLILDPHSLLDFEFCHPLGLLCQLLLVLLDL